MTISLTFPDGAKREFPSGITGKEGGGERSSPPLARRTLSEHGGLDEFAVCSSEQFMLMC